ncbi:putative leucine-rich repeat-containing protein DDB_G0290503 [Heptranchias perlo]|uniref:putative leucine-rich repeat-containing protein DDB_G0290503 n=1 Tax=Heptranchias perlo TaxID=212740 RepID=UPI00355A2139
MSVNKKLQKETNKALEDKVKGDESEADYFAYNPTAPAALQQRIEDLKSHLKDLQEANDSAINELTKADEEISQLRGEIAKLRTKHAEELQDAKQESVYFKDKINRLHCGPARHILEDNTFDLLEEIQQLRNESRKLRDANHRLDEENRQLKDVLWDFKRQREWISTKRFKEKLENVEINKRGDGAISAQKVELHKKEQETVPQKKSPLLSQLHCVSTSSQLRFEYFNIEEKNGPTKASEGVNNMTFDQRLQSWDDEDKDRATGSASPISVDSDCTEALIASCNNGTFGQASNSKEHHLEDIQTKQSIGSSNDAMSDVITDILLTPARLQILSKLKEKRIVTAEEKERSFSRNVIKGSLLDLDELSDDDMSSISQINGRHQFPYTHCSSSTPCKSIPSFPGFWSSCLNRNNPMRSIVNKAVLPRRPFAPRSIADLKIGHLVKFSRPAGKISKGVIKYMGLLPGRQEAYLGIELEGNEVGQHDGTFEGVRYFICKLKKGVFVNFSKVIVAWE